MSAAPIYVVVASDDMGPYRYERQGTPKNPIVFETNVNGATLEAAQARCELAERQGYGPCRIARLVFEDHPAFNEVRGLCGESDCPYFGKPRAGTCACGKVAA